MKRFILVAILMGVAGAAHAAEPILSGNRLGLGINAGYTWYGVPAGSVELPTFEKEFEVGLRAAYSILGGPEVEHPLALTLSSDYGLDNKVVRTRLGISLVLKKAGD